MAEHLPLRKYVKVWLMRRKNNPRKGGRAPTVSYTLQWVLYGKKHVMSLAPGATLAYARGAATGPGLLRGLHGLPHQGGDLP
jgi:hypothetical protein